MKKITALCLALLLCLTLLPGCGGKNGSALAQMTGSTPEPTAEPEPAQEPASKPVAHTSGDYTYILLPDGTAEITKYSGKAEALDIPTSLDGHTVTGIGGQAFNGCYALNEIIVPDSVTSIGRNTFIGCSSLKLTVPAGSYAEQYAKENGIPYTYPDN